MHIIDIYKQRQPTMFKESPPVLSIEVMPPRNGGHINQLYETIEHLIPFGIRYVSVTHGAGGNLRGGTVAIAALINERYPIEVLAHLTVISASKQEIENNLITLHYLGINNLLALRGDVPYGENEDTIIKQSDYQYAYRLMEKITETNQGHYMLRQSDIEFKNVAENAHYYQGTQTDFSFAGACYPECHKGMGTIDREIEYLKRKCDAGAEFFLTQMFFNNEHYWRFLDKAVAKGITQPIIPGLKPLASAHNAAFIQKMFHCEIPPPLLAALEKHANDTAACRQIGIEHTIRQCEDLLDKDTPGLHFYTMNKDTQITAVLRALQTAGYIV